jgi:hypothetical protein
LGVGVAYGHGNRRYLQARTESGRLLVHTTRTGLGAKAGHDLTIEVTRWRAHATVDPAIPANSSVTVEVDAVSSEPFTAPVIWTPPAQPLAAGYRRRPCRCRCGSVQPKMAEPH